MSTSKRLTVIRLVGAVALLIQRATVNALFTAPEFEAFNLSTSPFGFTVENKGNGTPATVTNTGPKTLPASLTFDQFDSGLGNLLGVQVAYRSEYSANATLNATVREAPAVTFSAEGAYSLSLTGPGGLNELLSKTIVPTCSVDEPPDTCSNTATQPVTAFNTSSAINLPPLSSFIGTGTFILTATLASAINPKEPSDNGTNFADNATFAGTLSNNWAGNVAVRFIYEKGATTGVPEPITLYLLLAGAGGIALIRRRPA